MRARGGFKISWCSRILSKVALADCNQIVLKPSMFTFSLSNKPSTSRDGLQIWLVGANGSLALELHTARAWCAIFCLDWKWCQTVYCIGGYIVITTVSSNIRLFAECLIDIHWYGQCVFQHAVFDDNVSLLVPLVLSFRHFRSWPCWFCRLQQSRCKLWFLTPPVHRWCGCVCSDYCWRQGLLYYILDSKQVEQLNCKSNFLNTVFADWNAFSDLHFDSMLQS